jgi:hypothetical protein
VLRGAGERLLRGWGEAWFQDEARVGPERLADPTVRTDRHARPRAVRDHRFKSARIFGTVCPERIAGVALVVDRGDEPHARRDFLNLVSPKLRPSLY